MKAKNTIGKIYVSQCLFRTSCKLQSICLIGGRVCNPRQQQVVDIQSILLLPRVKNPPPN